MSKISERTLRKWRSESLKAVNGEYPADVAVILFEDVNNRVLALTQQLLDQYLLENKEKKQCLKLLSYFF